MARHPTKRPRELALEILKLNKAVSPTEIDNHVGGEYSSKYICQLRKRGFKFEVVKNGRNVVSYTLTSVPKNYEEIKAGTKKQKAVKAKKVKTAPKATKAVAKTPAPKATPVKKEVAAKTAKESNLEKIKKIAEARKNQEDVAKLDALLEKMFLKKVPPVSSVSVDEDFDAIEDVRELV